MLIARGGRDREGGGTLGRVRERKRWCVGRPSVLEYPELGMEAIWCIEVVDFPPGRLLHIPPPLSVRDGSGMGAPD